jgi:hypothetical protein
MRCGVTRQESMDAVRVKSTRMVASALLNKGGTSPTEMVGRAWSQRRVATPRWSRVRARGRPPQFCAARHQAFELTFSSQHALPRSLKLQPRIGVRGDKRADSLSAMDAARPIRSACTTRHDSMEPQFLSPNAGWRLHTRHPAFSGRWPGVPRRPCRSVDFM